MAKKHSCINGCDWSLVLVAIVAMKLRSAAAKS